MAFSISDYKNSELSDAISRAPYAPGYIQSLKLFSESSVYRTHVDIEYKNNSLQILQTAERGSRQGPQIVGAKRETVPFKVPHIPEYATVRPDDIPDVREFGTRDGRKMMNSYITELLRDMRQNMEVTHEFHMMGALNGKVVNPDTTTIHNLFTLFGLTENSIDINFASASLEFMLTCSEITRYVQDSLGGTPNSGIMVLCGDTFYDNLTTLQEIKDAYNRPGQGEFLRTNHARKFIDYGNIRWVNYRGRVGNVTFLEDTQARVVPLGVPKMFIRKNGPDDTMNGVGKPGPKYKVTRKQYDHDGGWEFKAQSNPLIIATRPQCLIKLNDTTP